MKQLNPNKEWYWPFRGEFPKLCIDREKQGLKKLKNEKAAKVKRKAN